MDLTPFTYINPCGYAGLETTQLIDHVNSIDTIDTIKHSEQNLFQQAQDKLLHVLQTNLI